MACVADNSLGPLNFLRQGGACLRCAGIYAQGERLGLLGGERGKLDLVFCLAYFESDREAELDPAYCLAGCEGGWCEA